MPLYAKAGPPPKPIPTGMHQAVCYGVVDAGTHATTFGSGDSRTVILMWELPQVRGEFERDGRKVSLPRTITRRFTLSLGEKSALRKALESWRGQPFTDHELKGFDLKALIGVPCTLNVIHKTKTDGQVNGVVDAIVPAPRGTPRTKPERATLWWSFDEQSNGAAVVPAEFPDWVREIVHTAREFLEPAVPDGGPAAGDDAIPEGLPF